MIPPLLEGNALFVQALEEEELQNKELLPSAKNRAIQHRNRVSLIWPLLSQVDPLPSTTPIIVITGLQRTGSTLLHNLLAKHPSFVAPPLHRLHFVGEGLDDDQSRKLSSDALNKLYSMVPDLAHIHGVSADDAEECCHLFILCGIDRNAVLMANSMHTYLDWLLQLPLKNPQLLKDTYGFHSRLFRLATQKEGTPLLKDLLHMLFLDSLLDAFPDAIIVHTFRSPTQVLSSAINAYATLSLALHSSVAKKEIAQRICKLYTACLDRFCDTINKRSCLSRIIAVSYDSLIQDPMKIVQRICKACGEKFTREIQKEIESSPWMTKKPHNERNLDSLNEFGLSCEQVTTMFKQHAQLFKYHV